MCDGQLREVDTTIKAADLLHMATPAAGEEIDFSNIPIR
jgi:hypothetical protein